LQRIGRSATILVVTKLYTDDAEVYDIAFGWDVSEEVAWLSERLGRPRRVLEPGCGSGRMLAEFARRGVEIGGFDLSAPMIALARERLGADADLSVADMTNFDLGRVFDAAISPINTLLHLTPEALQAHLECMARHTPSYLVQVGLITEESHDWSAGSRWEAERGDTKLRCEWLDEEVDFTRGRSRQRSRIEVLSGPRAGEVIEEIHEMTLWTPETWAAAIDASPYAEVATYDGSRGAGRRLVRRNATGGLLWHQLVISPADVRVTKRS
jgi:SAM-dependent methyltransferase